MSPTVSANKQYSQFNTKQRLINTSSQVALTHTQNTNVVRTMNPQEALEEALYTQGAQAEDRGDTYHLDVEVTWRFVLNESSTHIQDFGVSFRPLSMTTQTDSLMNFSINSTQARH